MAKKKSSRIRDRIKELRRVRAGDLSANVHNWRTHPQAQVAAMQGILKEIGYAGALIARELADGTLELIDGHLRKELDPEQIVPVLILDVNEDEGKKLLLSVDPLAAMAENNKSALEQLLRETPMEDAALKAMADSLAALNGISLDEIVPDAEGLPDIHETVRHTVVVPYDDAEIPLLCKFLDLEALPERLGKAIIERIKAITPA